MPVYSVFGRLFHKVFSSRKLIDLLGANPVAGNLVITALVTATALSLAKTVGTNNSFSASSLCNSIFVDAEGRLVGQGAEVIGLSAKRVLSNAGNKIVTCSYQIERVSGSERKDYDVAYHALEKGLTANVEERKIKREDLTSICEDKSVYEKVVDFSPARIEPFLSASADNVYPAFRWRCLYYPPNEPILPSSKPDEQVDPKPEAIGINLDNFCERKYGDQRLTKAAYHYYADSDSWYCTDPNITASFD